VATVLALNAPWFLVPLSLIARFGLDAHPFSAK